MAKILASNAYTVRTTDLVDVNVQQNAVTIAFFAEPFLVPMKFGQYFQSRSQCTLQESASICTDIKASHMFELLNITCT